MISSEMKNILVLFPKDWDRLYFAQAGYGARYRFFYEGFDLFTFPENARLIAFDLFRFVDRLAAKYKRIGLDGIVSNNEQFGALIGALLAQRLGLPGLDPLTVITAQHKFYARERLKAIVPAFLPDYGAFPYSVKSVAEIPLPFPFFVKPVKATYSVLARRVDNFAELQRHLSFKPWETFIIKRLVKPFNDVMKKLTDFRVDAHHLIAESLLEGSQISVEGLVQDGEPHVLGIVDAVMYPGTQAFLRWEYPSRLPPTTQTRAKNAVKQIIQALGYNHGFFNVELILGIGEDDVKLIEINPRMASQFSDLYEKVDGLNLHSIELELSCGERPAIAPRAGKYRYATSFVFRKFDGTALSHPPTPAKLAWLFAFDPDAHLMLYVKRGRALAREMKWLGSYRYAVLNMGGSTEAELSEKHEAVKRHFEFETGYNAPMNTYADPREVKR
jgi:ATP-grasp domain